MASITAINVDLNKLFEAKLTYSFDPLKEVIEVCLSFILCFNSLNLHILTDLSIHTKMWMHNTFRNLQKQATSALFIGSFEKSRFAKQSTQRSP